MGSTVTKHPRTETPRPVYSDKSFVSGKEVDPDAVIRSLVEAIPTRLQEHVPPLIRVAAARDLASLQRLVDSGDGLNARNGHGQTPLHWAVVVQEEPFLESLLSLGRCSDGTLRLHLDAAEGHGFTALHYAAVTRNSFATHLLLEAGATVDCRDNEGQTPLMKAAKWDDVAQCRALLEAGADAAAADAAGRTALHLAAAAGNTAAVWLLLRHGAVAGAADCGGRSALSWALRSRRLDAARALLPAVATYTPGADTSGRTELHWAAANGTAHIVQRLLSLGLPRSHPDLEAMTPLMRALEARNEATATVLLDVGGRREQVPDARGMTALHWAARAGLAAAVRRLLGAGLSVWAPDHEGRDVLMWALCSNDEETVAAVLGHDGYQQRADSTGRTALHVAAMRGNAAVALTLLQHGADPDVEDCRGLTPLAWALCSGAHAVADVLRCYSAEEPSLGDMV